MGGEMILPHFTGSRVEQARELAGSLAGLYAETSDAAKPSPMRGGREAALAAWKAFSLKGYAARRNDCVGHESTVSRLSPYIRHGVVTLREVAGWVRERGVGGEDADKFWAELGWRQFWQIVYRRRGDAVWQGIEPAKVPLGGEENIPDDVEEGRTGLVCMDAFVHELKTTGWLHNHARMWMASYWVHFRKIRWQAGARFFYRHLLDGDPASNTLSWQWVASTFSPKAYIFNRENLERYTRGVYCAECRAACPFQGTYEEISARLFGVGGGKGA